MTETRNLARFATIANAAFNSMTANSTAILSMSVGGATINATSFAGTANNANNLVGGNITADYNVTQTAGIRFGHTNQADVNDGFIAAGRFASGLNIVGTQTGAGLGRQVRIYGTVIDGSGVEYVRNTGSWAINANSATFANSSATNTFTIGTAAYFVANGNFGIGTTSPPAALSILDKAAVGLFAVDIRSSNSTFGSTIGLTTFGAESGFTARRANGTAAAPTATESGNRLGFFIGSTTPDGTTFFNTAAINFHADATANSTSQPTSIRFDTTAVGATGRTERMRITANGNIGIGTTTPVYTLDLSFSGDNGARIRSTSLGSYLIFENSTGAVITNSSNTPMVFATTGIERMRIQPGNPDVTIGASTSYYTAANRASLTVSSTTDSVISLGGAGVGAGYLYGSSTILQLVADSKPLQILATGSNTLQFLTNSAERMRITATGDIGIGTSSPGLRLDVTGSIRSSQSITIGNGGGQYQAGSIYSDSNWGMIFRAAQSNPVLAEFLWTNASDVRRMIINTSGNVGIGTDSPSARLDVAGVSSTANATWAGGTDLLELTAASGSAFSEQAIAFQETGTNVGAKIGVKNRANGAYDIIFANRDNSSTTSTMTERMRISANGNIGIGTASPGYRLQIFTSSTNGLDGIMVAGGATTSRTIELRPAMGAGNNNGLVQAGDSGIIFSASALNSGAFVIAPWADTASGIRITSNGVGVGVSSPVTRLHVANTAQTDTVGLLQIESTLAANAVNASLTTKNFSGTSQFMQWENFGVRIGSRILTNSGQGAVVFTTGNDAERMRISADGSVGIGTSSPGQMLDVRGAVMSLRNLGGAVGATPTTPWVNTHFEARTTDASAAVMSLHRSGHSHVSLVHKNINELHFNFNSGEFLAAHSGNIGTFTANNATFINGNNVVTVMQSLRANRNLTGGGTISVDGSGNVLWTNRFIVISNGRGSHFSTNGYFDINCPTSGTITGVGGASNKTATAAGIPVGAWEALYYIMPLGSSNLSVAANFRVASYVADLEVPSNWLLICVQNGDEGNWYFNNGVILKAGQSYVSSAYTSTFYANAANITTGTLPDARLSSSVLLTSGTQTITGQKSFNSDNVSIANAGGGLARLEAIGTGGAAFMTFHRPGLFAGYFGLDSDNVWKVGGWSYGAAAFTLLHSGNVNTFATGLSGDQTIGGTKNFNGSLRNIVSSGWSNFYLGGEQGGYLWMHIGGDATNELRFGRVNRSTFGWEANPFVMNMSSGIFFATGDIRAPVFYDSNDTNSYFEGPNLFMRGNAPTIFFRDTDHNSAMIHCNSSLLYVLRGGNDTTGWSTVRNGNWPVFFNLTNNDLYCGGDIYAVVNIIAYASDKRLKENIKEIPNAIEKIKKIRGVTFDWSDKIDSLGFTPKQKYDDVGVIAQEIEEVMPQVVSPAPFDIEYDEKDRSIIKSKSGENYKTVQYERVVPLLIQAIKEQQAQIEELQAIIMEMRR